MASILEDFTLACEVGDMTWIKRCLRSSFDARDRDSQGPQVDQPYLADEGVTGLHMVCKELHLECLCYLLDHCNMDVNCTTAVAGDTPLHLAVRRPSTECGSSCVQLVKALLDRGADANKENYSGQTPLHHAAGIGHTALVRLLLRAGADVLYKDNEDRQPLDLSVEGGHYEVSRLLQALHWAGSKESQTQHGLMQDVLRKEMLGVERERRGREQQYRAASAFEEWVDGKNIAHQLRVDPGACQTRLDQRLKQSGEAGTCPTCLHSHQQARSTYAAQPCHLKPIHLSLVQLDRNVNHVGKPGLLYPYTNYPAQDKRTYGSGNTPSKKTRRGKKCPPSADPLRNVSGPRLPAKASPGADVGRGFEDSLSGEPPRRLTAAGGTGKAGLEEEEEDATDSPGELTFHEVEQNNLRGISSSAYIQQVLGDSTAGGNKPVSFHSHRHNAYRGKLQRRLSLGSIPEGRMVRCYGGGSSEELLDLWGRLGPPRWGSPSSGGSGPRLCSSAPVSPVGVEGEGLAAMLQALQDSRGREEELQSHLCPGGDRPNGDLLGPDGDCSGCEGLERPATPLPTFSQDYNSTICSNDVALQAPVSPSNLSSPSSPLLTIDHCTAPLELAPTIPAPATDSDISTSDTDRSTSCADQTTSCADQTTSCVDQTSSCMARDGSSTPLFPVEAWWEGEAPEVSGETPYPPGAGAVNVLLVSGARIQPQNRLPSRAVPKKPPTPVVVRQRHALPRPGSGGSRLSSVSVGVDGGRSRSSRLSRHAHSTASLRTSSSPSSGGGGQQKTPLRPTVMAFGGALLSTQQIPLMY